MLKLGSVFAGAAGVVVGATAAAAMGATLGGVGIAALFGAAAAAVAFPVAFKLTDLAVNSAVRGPEALALLPAYLIPVLASQSAAVFAGITAARMMGLAP